MRNIRDMRKDSFFEGVRLSLPEELLIITAFLKDELQSHISIDHGIPQHTLSEHYSMLRDVTVARYQCFRENDCFDEGERVEIDESLFGHKLEYHRGQKKSKVNCWVFGMVGETSGKVIAYPVPNRKEETLIPLIVRHTHQNNTIIHDDWSAYKKLEDYDREHYVIVHKYNFKTTYQKVDDDGTVHDVTICTNRIEGNWANVKSFLKRIRGTTSMRPAYLCQILFRLNVKRENWAKEFFAQMNRMYLNGDIRAKKPIFDLFENAPLEEFNEGNEHYRNRYNNNNDDDNGESDDHAMD